MRGIWNGCTALLLSWCLLACGLVPALPASADAETPARILYGKDYGTLASIDEAADWLVAKQSDYAVAEIGGGGSCKSVKPGISI